MRWRLIGFMVLFIGLGLTASAENRSLDEQLAEAKSDSAKVQLYNQAIKKVRKQNPDLHQKWAREALALAQRMENRKFECVFLRELGMYHQHNAQLDSALHLLQEALTKSEALDEKLVYYGILSNLATVQKSKGNYAQAAEHFYTIIAYFDTTGNTDGLLSGYIGLASVYTIQKNYTKSLELFKKCNALCKQMGKREIPCYTMTYTNLASMYTAINQFDSARYYIEKAIQLKQQLGVKVGLALSYHTLSNIEYKQQRYPAALAALTKELELVEQLKNKEGLIRVYNGMADVYRAQDQNTRAKSYLDKAAALLTETKNPFQSLANHKRMAKMYEEMGAYQEALVHHKRFKLVNDSLHNLEKEKALSTLQTQYRTRELEQEKLLEQEKVKTSENRLYGLVVLTILLVLVAALIIRQIQHRRKADRITAELDAIQQKLQLERKINQAELSALKAQMNPHFLFNAFNSIQEFIVLNKKELASDYLGVFADLMRMYLNHSQAKVISLEEELKATRLYLELEQLRFGASLSYAIRVDDSIEAFALKLPPMLLQPFIENAFKHGLLHKKTDRRLRLQFTLDADRQLHCIIEDNGVGRATANAINQQRHKKHPSFATSASMERIELMNQNREKPIRIAITDLKNEQNEALGTRVTLIVPQ